MAADWARRRAGKRYPGIEQQDAAEAQLIVLSISSHSDVEHDRQRQTPRHHLQHPLLTAQQCLGPLSVIDIGLQQIPKDDGPIGIPQRKAL